MRIIYNRFIPSKRYRYIYILGFFFCREMTRILPCDYNHEKIHLCQKRELLYIGFYILYIIEWMYRFLTNGFNLHLSRLEISFEKEAYDNKYDYKYTKKRKRFNMFRN